MDLRVVSDKKTEKDFFRVPNLVYKNDKKWIPHIRQDIQKLFDPDKNKLFKLGAEACRWVAYKNDQPVARIAAFINPKTKDKSDQATGGMGFFECIDEKDIAFALFDRCKNWLAEREMEAMDGPINFGERDQFWGVMSDQFDSKPIYGLSYNPPYYVQYLEEYGFKMYFEQYLFHRSILKEVNPLFRRKHQQVMRDPDFRIEDVVGKSIENIAEDFRVVMNAAWVDFPDFKPMKKDVAYKIVKSMKPIMDRKIIIFIYHKDQPVAFYINIPELNTYFKHVNGNLNWWGKIKFLYHQKFTKNKMMVGVIFGVVKEFQKKGLEGAMISHFKDVIAPKTNYTETVLSWIGDFNPRMLKVVDNLEADVHQTYRTYRYLFDRNKPFKRYPIQTKEYLEKGSQEK